MLGDEANGNDNKPEESKAEVPADEKIKVELRLNKAAIQDGVMTMVLYLEESDSDFAKAIGSLVLAQDMVKGYFTKKMVREQLEKERVMSKIIRPGAGN